MPWKELSKMNEKMKFVIRLNEGERMSDLCREFGIARKTGYKFKQRYEKHGLMGLYDQKKGPKNAANRTPQEIQCLIIDKKKHKKTWGAAKIREWLIKKYPNVKIPVKSTVHAILDRNDLVKKRKNQRRFKSTPTNLSHPKEPNDLWCTDFKGQFKMQNRNYCYPLTISDQESRFLLGCEGLDAINAYDSMNVFERVFKEYGLPTAIRSDNGEPFSSRSIWGLSMLSVWWMRLGIKIERIKPGHPEQNGRHERMHRTLKQETTKPAGKNSLHQQEIFDSFVREFNFERPHEGLKMKCPGEVYKKSSREYPPSLPEIKYFKSDYIKQVYKCGSIKLRNKKVFISTVLRGQPLGLTEVDEGVWEVEFMDYKLGFFDEESYKFSIADSPFIENVSPKCSV